MSDLTTLLDGISIPSARGRKAAPLAMEVIREIQDADLELLLNPVALGIGTSPVLTLRATHHQLARLLAEGRKAVECSAILGYTQSRISTLQRDPSFKELVAYYEVQVDAQYTDVHSRLATLGVATLDELRTRLEDNPEEFSNKGLMELAELCLDRAPALGAQKPSGISGPITIKFVSPGAPAEVDRPAGPGANAPPGTSKVIDLPFEEV